MAEAYEFYFRDNFQGSNRVDAWSERARPSESRDIFDIMCSDGNHVHSGGYTSRLDAFDVAIKINTKGYACPECGCKLWIVN